MILLDQAGAGASRTKLFSPLPAQESLVECFWTQQVCSNPIGQSWRIIPDASPHLIFVASRFKARCALVGARSRFADVSMAGRIFTCGARLRPGALPILTRLPASDFTDRSVPTEEAFGARGRILLERLAMLNSPNEALHLISDFLTGALADHDCAPRFCLGECARVEDMAAMSGLAVRTLHSRLRQHVGLSPKRALRIGRLQRALVGSQDRSTSWAQIAADSGFADQAHMIREFHDLLGESPTLWRQRSRFADLFKTVMRRTD